MLPPGLRRFHLSPANLAPKKRRGKKASPPAGRGGKAPKSEKRKKKQSGVHVRMSPRDPLEATRQAEQRDVPRAFLARTSSEYVYISQCAVMDEQTGEVHVDPRSLFSEFTSVSSDDIDARNGGSGDSRTQRRGRPRPPLPPTFLDSHFEYFPPSSFPNHEPPNDGVPEVAFLGRSNTGKSSLINALATCVRGGRGKGRDLARVSKRPGRTQTVNYFGLVSNSDGDAKPTPSSSRASSKGGRRNANLSRVYLVDLPGFGYAAAPDENLDEWQKKTQAFLISRASVQRDRSRGYDPWPMEQSDGAGRSRAATLKSHVGKSPLLKRLYLLMDSRLPEPPILDLAVMGWCEDYSIPYTVVLTKVDGTSRANCVKLTNQLCMRHHTLYMGGGHGGTEEGGEDGSELAYMDPLVYWTSAKDGLGMGELLVSIGANMLSDDGEDDDNVGSVYEYESEVDDENEEGWD